MGRKQKRMQRFFKEEWFSLLFALFAGKVLLVANLVSLGISAYIWAESDSFKAFGRLTYMASCITFAFVTLASLLYLVFMFYTQEPDLSVKLFATAILVVIRATIGGRVLYHGMKITQDLSEN